MCQKFQPKAPVLLWYGSAVVVVELGDVGLCVGVVVGSLEFVVQDVVAPKSFLAVALST